MLTSKARSELRAQANGLQAVFQIGKSGVEENLIKQVDDALEARELIKIKALETSPLSAKEAAEALAEATGADVVQVVGRAIVLWRYSAKKHEAQQGGARNAAKR
ncbi:MAG: ribosome assembly RNA-binding protein YhbY [Clostridia bacterium]|nr:ribosome assembly RNA-binding protein YhbY [Clostridia bacterium]